MTMTKKELEKAYKRNGLCVKVLAPAFVEVEGKDPVSGNVHTCFIFKEVVGSWAFTPLIPAEGKYNPFRLSAAATPHATDYYAVKEHVLNLWVNRIAH